MRVFQKAFARMCSIIDRQIQDLAELNRSLEHRVEERTADLQRTLTELRTTQDQLVQSEKMAALGGMVAGVAHEINTPLGVGITAASLLADEAARIKARMDQASRTR